MTRSGDRSFFPARTPAILSSKGPHHPDSNLGLNDKPFPRRRIRNQAITGARRSGPSTPLLRWKFEDADRSVNGRRKGSNAAVSARKLAGGMWHLIPPVVGGLGGGGGGEKKREARLGFQTVRRHLQTPCVFNLNNGDLHADTRNEFEALMQMQNPKNGISLKLETAPLSPISAMERATKWDPECSKPFDEAYQICSRLNVVDGREETTVSLVSPLRSELAQSHIRINELEVERQSSKRKMDRFMRKLAEEKASWRSKEHQKIRAIIDGMNDELHREKKNRQRAEIVNSKLVNEIAEAKLSAKQFLQDYEKERKSRELMEEVCDELAKEIAEDKAEVETLKRESMKIREELEEERKMLQMAEVWREERVQMKLIDAKVTLEEKYSQVCNLKADLMAFLRARISINPDAMEVKEAKLLIESVDSIDIGEIKEFSYQPPPASEDIFSVLEELQPREETQEREIEPCYGYSPASRVSRIHTVSPDTDAFLEKPTKRYSNGSFDRKGDVEDDSSWETVSRDEEQGSNISPAGSEPSVYGMYDESNASDWEQNGCSGKMNCEISEVCSVTTRQSRKKTPSITRLWKSSCPNDVGNFKNISLEATKGKTNNGADLSPESELAEFGLSPASIGQWSSPDSVNPHIARGMKGCIEWPRGMQKHSLKAKLLEARMESQKIQLRHVLKQKI